MTRRSKAFKPLIFLACLGLLICALALLWVTTVQMLDRNGQGLVQKEQQRKPSPSTPAPAQQPTVPTEAELQRYREAVEAYRAAELRKQEAWDRFFQPSGPCAYPESSQRAEVCRAHELKQRKAFELAWAEQLQREQQR